MALSGKQVCGSGEYLMNGVGCVSCVHICPDNGDDWRQCRTDCPEEYARHLSTSSTTGTTSLIAARGSSTTRAGLRGLEPYTQPWFAPSLLLGLALILVLIGTIVYKTVPRAKRFLDDLLGVFRRCGNVMSGTPALSVSANNRVSSQLLPGTSPLGSPVRILRPAKISPQAQTGSYQQLPQADAGPSTPRVLDGGLLTSTSGDPAINNPIWVSSRVDADVHANQSNSFHPVPEQGGLPGRDRPGFLRQISTQSNPEQCFSPHSVPPCSSSQAAVTSGGSHTSDTCTTVVVSPSEPDGPYRIETGCRSFERLPNRNT